MTPPFRPAHFQRADPSPDAQFYASPRFVVHVDDAAVEAIGRLLAHHLPPGGIFLDLMSSWRSHFPATFQIGRLVGLGMNDAEMAGNPQLDEHVVHDLNREPVLPFANDSFDGAIVTVSVQYLTRPVEVFREVGRVLRPGAKFLVIFSNRMFPTKAIALWQMLDDHGRGDLITEYFRESGAFGEPVAEDWTPRGAARTDPVFLRWATNQIGDTIGD